MTRNDVLKIALDQSAADIGCAPWDFLREDNVVVRSEIGPKARAYYKEPIACNLVSYGNNIVASVKDEYRDLVTEYIGKFDWHSCFETPNLHWLDDRLLPFGQRVCFMAEYFLPDPGKIKKQSCPYRVERLGAEDFRDLYKPEWSNALCEKRKELDLLGFGAYDGETLVGLAACSKDCETMYQIGVDVLFAYRQKGIASALTSRLSRAVLDLGKVPFYCAAWSNLRSVKNALKCGFFPAWVELTAKPAAFVAEMNE